MRGLVFSLVLNLLNLNTSIESSQRYPEIRDTMKRNYEQESS